MNQSLCMLLINFSSPRLQNLQRTGMGEASAFFEQLYHRMIISTMGRQEVRVMSTWRGDEFLFLVLLARRAGSLYSSFYKKNDKSMTNL